MDVTNLALHTIKMRMLSAHTDMFSMHDIPALRALAYHRAMQMNQRFENNAHNERH